MDRAYGPGRPGRISISGEVPEDPVVSRNSGLLFEKRLIERHISDYGKCPITGEPLTMDDIVPIKTGKIVKPRPVQAASIPGMLGMFQNEWDGLMLSNFALEQQLHTARQELSHALYQHDAACRVIARLKKERDEARSVLAQAERQFPASAPNAITANDPVLSNGKRGFHGTKRGRQLFTLTQYSCLHNTAFYIQAYSYNTQYFNTFAYPINVIDETAEDEDLAPGAKKIHPGISSSIISELTDCNASLSQQRKKRQIPATLAPVEALEAYTQISSHPFHKTNKQGIISLDILYSKDLIATGGIDTNAVIFDRPSGQILATLSGHSKKVTSVKFVAQGESFLTASADKTVRLWQGSDDGNYNCRHILKDHTAEGRYSGGATPIRDGHVCSGTVSGRGGVARVAERFFVPLLRSIGGSKWVQAVTVHATNNYFVTASLDGSWCFYELSSGTCLTQVYDTSGSSEGYTSAAFHPDGLILGTGTTESLVKIWDVKSQANVARFDGHAGPVTAISFSENGYFLATAAHDGVKLWDLRKLKNFRNFAPYDSETPTSSGKNTCVKFGSDSKYIAVGSMDRNLRILGLPGEDAPTES
ncbi:hypothetical protein JHK87_027967 [Glycine soja]|nr:hypothetical protein JHK87_027967 [Glycine soja]